MTEQQPQTSPLELERTFELMDVADEIRRRRRRVDEHLEVSDREAIKEHLLERYAAMGHTADPELLDEAIDLVLANTYRFRPPAPGLGLRLARVYVRRGAIVRRLTVPLVALGLLVVAGGFVANRINDFWYGRAERAVEHQVNGLAQRAGEVAARYERLSADVRGTTVDGARESSSPPEVEVPLSMADERLGRARLFLDEIAPGGDVESAITDENYARVDSQTVGIAGRLDEASGYLDEVEVALVAGRLVDEAQRLHDRIVEVAVEAGVGDRAARHLEQVRETSANGRGDEAEAALASLRDLERILTMEYTIRIVAGVERDEARTYLVVEALDGDGNPVAVSVRSEETGQVESVSEWGERVGREAYEAVQADFDDNGLIDDDVFGRKTRGVLEVERDFEDLGQITDW